MNAVSALGRHRGRAPSSPWVWCRGSSLGRRLPPAFSGGGSYFPLHPIAALLAPSFLSPSNRRDLKPLKNNRVSAGAQASGGAARSRPTATADDRSTVEQRSSVPGKDALCLDVGERRVFFLFGHRWGSTNDRRPSEDLWSSRGPFADRDPTTRPKYGSPPILPLPRSLGSND